ncbi:MAG TPA: hypothetical protein VNR65_18085 [Geobacterales bacterium]|nr:hypothetical protein [Geobacterales bacterium]
MPATARLPSATWSSKLDVLEVVCDKCGRESRYALASLVRYRMVAFGQ